MIVSFGQKAGDQLTVEDPLDIQPDPNNIKWKGLILLKPFMINIQKEERIESASVKGLVAILPARMKK